MQITLSPEVGKLLEEQATQQGRTPAQLVEEDFKKLYYPDLQSKPSSTKPEKTLADRLEKHIGTIDSSEFINGPSYLSENTTEEFTKLVAEKHGASDQPNKGEGLGLTLADFLHGYVGVIDSSEYIEGGAQLSQDTGKKFAQLMVEKREKGKL